MTRLDSLFRARVSAPVHVPSPRVRRLLHRLRTPEAVQAWLDRMPYNWERRGETLSTLPSVLRRGSAHCLEAALAAATILEWHGHPPILLDLESVDLLDHVLLLFRKGGRLGTVARSRDPGLHGRKPVFRTLRELVRSYAAPYIDATGRIKGYGVLDLRTLRRADWRDSRRNVWYVERALIDNPHRPFHTPEALYRRWHRRYLEFKRRHPSARPVYYPGRLRWLNTRM